MCQRRFFGIVLALITASSLALAQDGASGSEGSNAETSESRFERGRDTYEAQCAQCHQDDGTGTEGFFPALAGNDDLEDLSLIVGNVREGRGAMPAFPDLDASQIAAVATYVRNAWDNDFGNVSEEDVTSALEALEEDEAEDGEGDDRTSVWDGVYTEAQAERGQNAYSGTCAACHGNEGDGAGLSADAPLSPPLAGTTFLRDWSGSSLAALYEVAKNTMPLINPGGMSDQQYVDIIAYLLQSSDMPAGSEELPPDPEVLQNVTIEPSPDAE